MVASNFEKSLRYEPETGKLVWLRDSNNRQRLAGEEAGGLNGTGYLRLKVGGREFLAHRVAWTLMTGSLPAPEVDHINGIRNDNRWCNLRLVNASKQRANAKINANSTSGVRGVYFNKRRGMWRAHLQRRHLGYFQSKDEAATAVEKAFNEAFGLEYRRAA